MPPQASDNLLFSAIDPDSFFAPPTRHYDGDAGYDLTCSEDTVIPAGGFGVVPTNIRVALPRGTWCLITGRSSTFRRKLITVAPVIDNGWRGELFSSLFNASTEDIKISKGERVTQIILFNLVIPEAIYQAELPPGDRGEKGFGSTGG